MGSIPNLFWVDHESSIELLNFGHTISVYGFQTPFGIDICADPIPVISTGLPWASTTFQFSWFSLIIIPIFLAVFSDIKSVVAPESGHTHTSLMRCPAQIRIGISGVGAPSLQTVSSLNDGEDLEYCPLRWQCSRSCVFTSCTVAVTTCSLTHGGI